MSKRLLILSAVILLFGSLAWNHYHSDDSTLRRSIHEDALMWYYAHSVEKSAANQARSARDREQMIALKRAVLQLDERWEFLSEDFSIFDIPYASIGEYSLWMQNRDTEERVLTMERRYFDLDSVTGVVVSTNVTRM